MKKISTLYKKDASNLALVTRELGPENEWALTAGIPTRKFDGTACAIIGGELYKRYDAKHGKSAPEGAIPCQEADAHGHHPHWINVTVQDKYHLEAFNALLDKKEGTYELCGPRINRNREQFETHILVRHGEDVITDLTDLTYDSLFEYLKENDIEGIVFHEMGGDRLCKIRKVDFGLTR